MAEQEEIDAALDAALDELDDDDDDDDDELEAKKGFGEKAVDKDVAALASANQETTEEKKDCPVVSDHSKNDTKPAAAAAAKTASEIHQPKPVVMGPPRPPAPAPASLPFQPAPDDSSSMVEEERFFAEMMAQVQSQFSGSGDCSNANEPPEAFLERLMKEMQSQMQSDMQQQQPPAAAAVASSSSPRRSAESKTTNAKNKNGDKKKKSQNSSKDKSSTTTTKKSNEVDQAISNLIEDMAKKSNQEDDDDGVDDDVDGDGDEEVAMLQQLMKGLGELGTGGTGSGGDFLNNADAMIDGMMEQLMSKDLMYEPMKQVTDKFPQWLQDRKTVLSPDEYTKREKQFECFQQLVHVYETEPNNNAKLVSLMQQAQEYGQPPAEIIQEIAPGLDLDPDGVPKFQFPSVGGTGGPLLPPGMNEEDCVVM